MNKLLKRALMLGTLVVCLATAAWAGNVEVDWVGRNVGANINYAADGYYQNSEQHYYYGYNGERTDFDKMGYEYYFDANGNMTWGQRTDGIAVFRNDYDKNGNLIRSVSQWNNDSEDVTIETYTYDANGLLTMSKDSNGSKGYSWSNTYYYTYGYNQVTVKYVYDGPYGGSETYTIVYTLDDNGNVVKRANDDGDVCTYTYDARGNLTETQYPDGGKYTFEYNDQDLCVKQTYVSAEGYETATTYKYDEHGNVIEELIEELGGSYSGYIYTYAPIPQTASQSDFEDVDANSPYTMPIIWAAKTGITTGKTATTFAPKLGCTRAQMVTFLWRAAGSPEPKSNSNPFTDVNKNSPYYKAIQWAVEKGITNGISATQFSPNVTCTRAQIVTFIYRAAGRPAVKSTNNPFKDVTKNSYYDAILWAVENGVTNGFNATTFAPSSTCTRAQGVTFLYRSIGLY